MLGHLSAIYGKEIASKTLTRLREILGTACRVTGGRVRNVCERLDEKSAVLITYGDQVSDEGVSPLRTLTELLSDTVGGAVSHVHVLPFFPYSSDDGFSVIDYEEVDGKLGSWGDIRRLAERFGLMADLVLNHISAESPWFKSFLAGGIPYQDFFVTMPEGLDLSRVVRPRTSPLLTRFHTAAGERSVWTTFSEDQVDLNYANPEVLLRMVEILLRYVAQGITMVRLDAVAFLWKEAGTSCIHLPQTHRIIQLFRSVLDAVAPDVLLVSETNVPHTENVTYFGSGGNEAQLVYQFPLPPLVLSAFQQRDATPLSCWLRSIDEPPGNCVFFNFLASHDGIGLRPAEGILGQAQEEALVQQTVAHGGRVSYRTNADGSAVPYELNISYFDALSDPAGESPHDLQVSRFLTAHAMMLCLAGVPGIYFHSLFGSRSWCAGVELLGTNRAINREKLKRPDLVKALDDPRSLRHRVFDGFRHLLRARGSSRAFRPRSRQEILTIDPRIFAVRRWDPESSECVCCLHNVTQETVSIHVGLKEAGFAEAACLLDLLGSRTYSVDGEDWLSIRLSSFQSVWLTTEIV
ncbi:sugar phosphorylase [Candidatus Bipolaricaulota bacterium]|nr:sugar phosphorylase [Candidatus Bipolaricaulota bacterium]